MYGQAKLGIQALGALYQTRVALCEIGHDEQGINLDIDTFVYVLSSRV